MTEALKTGMPSPPLHLVTDAKQLAAVRRKLGITSDHEDRPQWKHTKGTRGMTWTMQIDDVPVWVVAITPGQDPLTAVGTLVHEAVHVWQGWKTYIAEDSPSAEFEAYSIEAISIALMTAYKGK